jgi:NitT/TauT family transport system permease protein|tara:strand:+ start:1895 stop:2845 length:951 start_codon:yes stop_codon:yes gene_type:complete
MKSSDTPSSDQHNDQASNSQESDSAPERFDMSTIIEVPKWQRVLNAIDLPVQFIRIGLLALIIWAWESRWIFKGWTPFGFELFPEIIPLFQGVPSEAVDFFQEMWNDSLFWGDFWVTLQEALLGFAIGSSAGFLVGLLLGSFKKSAKVLSPFLIFTNAVPKIALAPILILWYGVDIASKVALATIIVFFIVQVPVQAAVNGVDPDLDVVATSMGATQYQKFKFVVIPGILGPLFGALRLSAIYSILAVVLGEFIVSKRGLGQRLLYETNNFGMGRAIALITILAGLALILNAVIGLMESRFLRWQDSEARGKVISL